MRVKCRVSPDMHLLSQTEYYYYQYRKNNQAQISSCNGQQRFWYYIKDSSFFCQRESFKSGFDIDVEILVLN